MARKYANGPVEWQMSNPVTRMKISFHANGHILIHAGRRGWKQWAIVPRDAMGSVADWLTTKGYQFQGEA